jgi:lipid-A-disaccharide synthase
MPGPGPPKPSGISAGGDVLARRVSAGQDTPVLSNRYTGACLRPSRLLVSCGEPSGDFYGAEVVRHLRAGEPGLEVFGLGGDHLEAQGASLLAHTRDLAMVGITEVVLHIARLRRLFGRVVDEIDRRRPDAAVLVDYPDFNLRLAQKLKARGVPVVYYVSPQIWAWKGGRIRTIRDTVARMLVIFPFEEELYRRAGVNVTFVGHPLVDAARPAPDRGAFLRELGLDPARPVVALLPGSRRGEVAHNLPPLAGAVALLAGQRPDLQFLLARAPGLDDDLFDGPLAGRPVRVVAGRSQAVVGSAEVALVASGTATVETALLGIPMVVVYRLSPLTYFLGRPFVHVDRYAMPNLVAGRLVVPELIQADFTPERVAQEAISLLEDQGRAAAMRRDLASVRLKLGGSGASERAAGIVRNLLETSSKNA